MGMAASQGRLLMMTARISNNEFEQQCVAYSKQRLADDSQQANDQYLDALQATQYQVIVGYNGDTAQYEAVSYNVLTGFNNVASSKQYIVSDNTGKIVVSQKIADAFENANHNYNDFLKSFGLTQIADRDVTDAMVHDAWDRYLVSVGKGDANGIYLSNGATNHITGFSYNIGWNSTTNSKSADYVTYNSAYASTKTPSGDEYKFSMMLDDKTNEYVVENAPIMAESYIDGDGNTQYGAYINLCDVNHGQQKFYLDGIYAIPVEEAYDAGIKYVDAPLSFKSQDGSQGYIFYFYNNDGEKVRLCNNTKSGAEVSGGEGYDNGRNCCIDVLSFVRAGFQLINHESGSGTGYKYQGTSCVTYPMFSYQSDDPWYGVTFSTTSGSEGNDQGGVLFYEGTTKEQRELYDYAMALTERYAFYTYDSQGEAKYSGGNLISQPAVAKLNDLTYDADKVQYYKNIFDQMTSKGYTTYDKMIDNKYINTEASDETKPFASDEWLIRNIKNGKFVISYYSANDGDFIKTTLDDDESIVNKENKSKMAIAEQVYQNHMDRIEAEDKRFDMQLTKLESEHTALLTEYDSVAKVISKNVEKSFGIFNA